MPKWVTRLRSGPLEGTLVYFDDIADVMRDIASQIRDIKPSFRGKSICRKMFAGKELKILRRVCEQGKKCGGRA